MLKNARAFNITDGEPRVVIHAHTPHVHSSRVLAFPVGAAVAVATEPLHHFEAVR